MKELQANSILALAEWKLQQPSCKLWMDTNNVEELQATRIVSQVLRSVLFDIQNYTGESIEQILSDLGPKNRDILYAICDDYHLGHQKLMNWIDLYGDGFKDKKNSFNVLDYYGKSAELSIRIAKACRNKNIKITYVDQPEWFGYAKFRLKYHKLYNVRIEPIEVNAIQYRPELTRKYAVISTMDLPINPDQEWHDWLSDIWLPMGFLLTRHSNLAFKKIDIVGPFTIYQNTPSKITV